ncbi:hypothetical protein [Hymenobacter lucidus]|uniref:Uncharacterized protein n=1 Tax=Hymenobacter lucidus TaxID=2880930 RepID=A0ABS8AR81_9BACT|nr:hypothetical protein [Hymenobacter lucidus]MCB2408523.1 hypothetical protein [Hymenobacter lucidus]
MARLLETVAGLLARFTTTFDLPTGVEVLDLALATGRAPRRRRSSAFIRAISRAE